jgi:hypothetical protein
MQKSPQLPKANFLHNKAIYLFFWLKTNIEELRVAINRDPLGSNLPESEKILKQNFSTILDLVLSGLHKYYIPLDLKQEFDEIVDKANKNQQKRDGVRDVQFADRKEKLSKSRKQEEEKEHKTADNKIS